MRYTDNKSGSKTLSQSNGFSAVELLITLFIASAFLISGYQLYAVAIKDGGETRIQSLASTEATKQLKIAESNATNPCTPYGPSTVSSGVTGLTSYTVDIKCHKDTDTVDNLTGLSKILVTITYGTPPQSIIYGEYFTK